MKQISELSIPAVLAASFFLSEIPATGQEMPVSPEPGASAPTGINSVDAAGPVREIRMLPNHKRALALKDEERNPYARRTPDLTIEETDTGEETESDRIRRVLTGIQVTGRTYTTRGIVLLAGDIIIERGMEVPRVLEDQTERLVVESVTEDLVILGWVDPESGEPTGKRLNIAYDMEPVVVYQLPGQPSGRGGEKKDLKFGTMRRDTAAESMAEESSPERTSDVTAERTTDGVLQEIIKKGQ